MPSGKGTLPITSGGVQRGCVISGGTWFTSGTCASFTATPSGTVSPLSRRGYVLIFSSKELVSPLHPVRVSARSATMSSRAPQACQLRPPLL